MSKVLRSALLTLFAIGVALGARGCGGVTDDRVDARDRTTKAVCDRYNACGLIGMDAGDTYPTYDSCAVTWRANWEMWWPPAECKGQINQMQLGECISAIGGTDCASVVDFLLTLGKCAKEMVCTGNAKPDGG
jgi:hypothetical protein